MKADRLDADVCLLVEGAYPYVTGGVSSWTHDLIRAQSHLRFHVVALVADHAPRKLRFALPGNVVGLSDIVLHQHESGMPRGSEVQRFVNDIEGPLARLFEQGGLNDFSAIVQAVQRHATRATRAALMNSEAAFAMLQRMYEASVPGSSFLNYFWSWRSLAGGLFSVLLAPLPRARVYHAISTGYAGLALARAVLETGRPGLLTEHGIYTNERRVEIAMADWLTDKLPATLDLDKRRRDLRDVWIEAFIGYSQSCYQSCSRITTLYAGNQQLQLRDGAPADRLVVIPNGVDCDALSSIPRDPSPRRPTVALIGRVVPIKDVKTCIRAAALLRDRVPGVLVQLLGPTDEDPVYFAECEAMVKHLDLGETFQFCGRVQLQEHLGRIDVVVLTSISEAQPLVLLEAGAAGVPSVATHVGCCRDLLLGQPGEMPALGAGGIITPLANPVATADALARLLLDPDLRLRYGQVMRLRAHLYYNRNDVDQSYRELYEEFLYAPEASASAKRAA